MNKRQISALQQLHNSLAFSEGWGEPFTSFSDVIEYREFICEKRSGNEHQQQRYEMFHVFTVTAMVYKKIDIKADGVSAETFMKNAYRSQIDENTRVIDRELSKIDQWIEAKRPLFE